MSLVLVATPAAAAPPAHPAVHGVIRVDQAGYAPGEHKQAYLMATAPATGLRFTVVDAKGRSVLSGNVAATSRGAWNAGYPAVYPIDVSRLDRPGTYRIRVGDVVSPGFPVRSAAALYDEVVRDGVTFFHTQRDTGHRNDKTAMVYATPHFA